MIHPLKITGTLADETRYQIYEFMLKQKKSFTVQDIAEAFSIHPNVARLHLTKLTEINVISADFLKSGKGGRPGRIYKATEDGVELSFPKRDHRQLLKWTIQLIEQLGEPALEQAKKISYDDGFNEIQTILKEHRDPRHLQFDEKLSIIEKSATLIGYIPTVTETSSGKKIIFSIYNCPFNDLLLKHNKTICGIHESYLKGQIDALFPQNNMFQLESIIHDCDLCQYEIDLKETVLS